MRLWLFFVRRCSIFPFAASSMQKVEPLTSQTKEQFDYRSALSTKLFVLFNIYSGNCLQTLITQSKYNTMSSQDTSDIEGMRAQISGKLPPSPSL